MLGLALIAVSFPCQYRTGHHHAALEGFSMPHLPAVLVLGVGRDLLLGVEAPLFDPIGDGIPTRVAGGQ
jgi:hypothetical protein